jgi:hypothetical protein
VEGIFRYVALSLRKEDTRESVMLAKAQGKVGKGRESERRERERERGREREREREGERGRGRDPSSLRRVRMDFSYEDY